MPRVKPIPVARTVALCYVRRSWVRDEKELVSPQMQREHIERVCQQQGWTAEWYEDLDGHRSGMTEKNRPGWLALKTRLESPDVAALVAYDLSRLHRKGWRISQLLDFVDQYGIRLVIADPARQIDFSSTYGRFFAQMSAIFDEYYALDISNRRKAQAAYKRKQHISSGIPPFGTVRNAEGYLAPSPLGCWYLPDGSWVAGAVGELPPEEGAIWRGYHDCAHRIFTLYVEGKGRATLCKIMREEGWAFRSIKGQPAPLSNDAIVRVTKGWPEYGGIVLGKRAKDRQSYDLDPDTVTLDPNRAVFDVDLLKQVGRVAHERSFKRTDNGHNVEAQVYALAGLLDCAQCDRLAEKQNNPLLRTRLIGKGKSATRGGVYRHRPGLECGCKHKQVQAPFMEAEFMRLCTLLSLSDEAQEALRQFATTLSGAVSDETVALDEKRTAAMAKLRRKLEAARHLYEEGEISHEDYINRKQAQEAELLRWERYTTEARQTHIELMLCAEAFNRLVGLWETADDEGRQFLARGLFEEIVFDLDDQVMVGFKLKAWAERFLVVRGLQTGAKGTAVPPAGIEPAPLPPEGNALSAELRGR